jgi:hypothetical protein
VATSIANRSCNLSDRQKDLRLRLQPESDIIANVVA